MVIDTYTKFKNNDKLINYCIQLNDFERKYNFNILKI